MRIVANYETSLLDYINSDKDIRDVLSEEVNDSCLTAAAKKTLEENGISLDGSTTSTDDTTYSEIKTATTALRENAAELASSTIYSEAESSGDTSDVVSEITDFVSNYNDMVDGMSTMGGTTNTTYLSDLSSMITANSDALETIGITMNEDGTLAIDSDTLSSASVSDLKSAFCGTSTLADKIAQKSVYVEANAISAMYSSTISSYTSSGSYTDSTLSSFLQSI